MPTAVPILQGSQPPSSFIGTAEALGEWLGGLFAFAVGPAFVAFAVAVILIYFLYHLVVSADRVAKLRKHLTQAADVLSKAVPASAGDGARRQTAFAGKWEETVDRLRRIGPLRHAIGEFTETLVLPETDPEKRGVVLNTKPPDDFLSTEKVLEPALRLRSMDAVPGQLTGLGILFTFVGLAAGIAAAQADLTGTTEEIQDALAALLDGASLAFTTSIFGLFLSILFLVLERWAVGRLQGRLATVNELLEEGMQFLPAEAIQLSIANQGSRSVQQQEQMLTIQRTMASTARKGFSSVEESVGRHVRDIKRDFRDFINEFAITLSEEIARAIDRGVRSEEGESLSDTLEKLIQELRGLRADQRTASEEMIRNVAEQFGAEVTGAAGKELRALGESLVGLDDALKSSTEEFRRVQHETVMALRDGSDQLVASLRSASELLRKQVESSAQATSQQMTGLSETIAGQMNTAIETMARQFVELSGEIRDVVRGAMSESGSEMERAMGGAAQRLLEASHQVGSNLNAESGRVQTRLEALQEAIEQTAAAMGQIATVSTAVGEASLGMQLAAEGFAAVEPGLKVSAEHFRNAGSDVRAAAVATREYGESARDALVKVGEVATTLETQWETYVGRFEGSDAELARVVNTMQEGVAGLADRLRDFMTGVDQQFGDSLDRLSAAVGMLKETVDELIDLQESRP